jgi:acyl-CoA reductase-like NAD-dependent aldehyde dehydrogenase
MKTAQHYINGAWLDAVAGTASFGTALDPASSEPVARYAEGGIEEAAAAVRAARAAFDDTSWRRDARLRASVLLRFADRLEQRKDDIAAWLVKVNGKLLREAHGELGIAISELRYYAGLARTLTGRTVEVEPGCYSALEREAAGVAAIIVPWNAPITLLVRSLAPALAAGCSVVIKPAQQTSMANNLVLECLVDDARLPPGLVNSVIESGSSVSGYLCESAEVDVVSFTGSTLVGKLIARSSADTLKRLSLELGGKAPALVFEDCDIDRTVAGVVQGALIMAGQQCTAVARVLVADEIYDRFRDKLADALGNVKLGRGDDPATTMGPLIDVRNRDRIAGLVAQAEATGKLLVRGRVPDGELGKGAFISPSLVEVEDLASPFIQNELFGPLLVLERFADDNEAVARANATRYSLASSVWTTNAQRARRVAARLKFGTVWCNAHNRLFPEAETGGYGDSGYGKLHGEEGMNDFMVTKHVYFETGE